MIVELNANGAILQTAQPLTNVERLVAVKFRSLDWDPAQAARSRRKFLGEITGTGQYVLPIHFPHPTTGLIEADGARFRYKFVR